MNNVVGNNALVLSDALNGFEVVVKDGQVQSNLSVLKAVISAKKEEIGKTVFTGDRKDRLKMIKGERAAINKFTTACNEQRKTVKNQLLEPYTLFEKEIKEVISISEELYDDLNTQAKELEEERKAEKRTEIRSYYDEIASTIEEDFKEDLYKLLYDTSWENESSTKKAYQDALTAGINTYTTGIQVITTMSCDTDVRDEALRRFKMDLNVSTAMLYISKETASRAEAKAREEARLAEERKRMEEETARKIEEARLAAERKARAREEARLAEERKRMEEETARKVAEAIEAEREAKAREEALIIEDEVVATTVAIQTSNIASNKILVEFSVEDWEAIEAYCYDNEIFFVRK